jgi:hypothetical protein
MKIHYLQHVEYEDLGFIDTLCEQNDIQLSKTALYAGEPVFPDVEAIDG